GATGGSFVRARQHTRRHRVAGGTVSDDDLQPGRGRRRRNESQHAENTDGGEEVAHECLPGGKVGRDSSARTDETASKLSERPTTAERHYRPTTRKTSTETERGGRDTGNVSPAGRTSRRGRIASGVAKLFRASRLAAVSKCHSASRSTRTPRTSIRVARALE